RRSRRRRFRRPAAGGGRASPPTAQIAPRAAPRAAPSGPPRGGGAPQPAPVPAGAAPGAAPPPPPGSVRAPAGAPLRPRRVATGGGVAGWVRRLVVLRGRPEPGALAEPLSPSEPLPHCAGLLVRQWPEPLPPPEPDLLGVDWATGTDAAVFVGGPGPEPAGV